MMQHLVETMHGHQVIRDNQFRQQVHTKRMHQFFYGFTMVEALISLALMSLFLVPIANIKINESELDMLMRFKVELYRRDLSCEENILFIDENPQGSSCEILDEGFKIIYKNHVIYYVKP